MNDILFSHQSDDWSTPLIMYNYYKNLGYIDPCPLFSDQDNLAKDYYNCKLFINPPFSKLSEWVDFSIRQFNNGCTVVLLMPARTDTKYFHKLLVFEPSICFIKGRLCFGSTNRPAPFPTILVRLDPYCRPIYVSRCLSDFE